jgi:hypothetical protein
MLQITLQIILPNTKTIPRFSIGIKICVMGYVESRKVTEQRSISGNINERIGEYRTDEIVYQFVSININTDILFDCEHID